MNGRLYFACDDGTNKGEELCTSDGTAAGTFVVKDINPGPSGSFSRDNERSAGVGVGDKYVFRALVTSQGATRDQLWVSGGCAANTFELLSIQSSFNINARTFRSSPLQPGAAFFFASGVGPQDDELWRTDGTPQGTDVVADACPTVGCGGAIGADDIGFLGNKVFWSASSSGGGTGNQLWEFDSASKQAKQSVVLNPGVNDNPDFFARGFVQFGTSLLFVANDGTARVNRLWRTDGTAAGTQVVSRTTDGITTPLVLSGNNVYFQAKDRSFGNELHSATLSAAQVVKDLILGEVDGWAEEITDMGGYVLFSGDKELYRSDGTAQGTSLVKDINQGTTSAGPGQSYPRNFIRAGATNKLYFSGDDGRNGRELWVSDGTPAGTTMVMDINPGAADSSPQDFTVVGGYLYFSAETAANGRELWRVLIDSRVTATAPPIVCPSTQQTGGTWMPSGAIGACCANGVASCNAVSAAQCQTSGGKFQGAGSRCETTTCNLEPASGVCCDPNSTKCWPGQPKANCDQLNGVLKAGTECSACWMRPATPAPAGAPTPAATTGNCCANNGCLQSHTQQSCTAINAAARFIGAEQCLKCFQSPTQIDAACTTPQSDFCKLVCGGADLLASCTCMGTTVRPVCNGAGSPSSPSPSAPVGSPFPVTVPGGAPATNANGGAPITGINVPVTQPNGAPATQPNGAPITNVVVPVTDANGNVPNPSNTRVIVPVTDARGNVIGTNTASPGFSPPPFVPPPFVPPGQTPSSTCSVLPAWCAMVCGDNPVASCNCSGVSCGKAGAEDTTASAATPALQLAAVAATVLVAML